MSVRREVLQVFAVSAAGQLFSAIGLLVFAVGAGDLTFGLLSLVLAYQAVTAALADYGAGSRMIRDMNGGRSGPESEFSRR